MRYKDTIGVIFFIKEVKIPTFGGKIVLWDVNSKWEGIERKLLLYFRDAEGVMAFYDVANSKSFQDVEVFIEKIHNYTQENAKIMEIAIIPKKGYSVIFKQDGIPLMLKYPSRISIHQLQLQEQVKIETLFRLLIRELIKIFK